MKTCKHCGVTFDITDKSSGWFGNHVRWCDANPSRKKVNVKTLNCSSCGKVFTTTDRRVTCSEKCSKTRTLDQRKSIAKGRSDYLKNNPDKHPWKNNEKFKSVPCENVKKYLRDRDIDFIEELRPLTNRQYSLDIAFPHIKTAIEVNGQQHYNSDGSLKRYYQERHDLIENSGWNIIEVHYSQCFSDENISKFLNFDIPYDDKNIVVEYKKIEEQKKKNAPLKRGEKMNIKMNEKWNPVKDEIFNHNIDFSKYGWSTQVAKVMGIIPQKVNKWMKRYHKDFYENSCFKRKRLDNKSKL